MSVFIRVLIKYSNTALLGGYYFVIFHIFVKFCFRCTLEKRDLILRFKVVDDL